MRESKSRSKKRLLQFAAGLLLLGWGAIWLTDRPGLCLEYYTGVGESLPSPAFREIGLPQVEGRKQVAPVLVSQEIFSLRWSGWLWVETAGDYYFVATADEDSFVELKGQVVARTSKSHRSVNSSRVYLEKGPHPIALGLTQTGGRARFRVRWARNEEEPRALEIGSLFARSPVRARRLLRSVPLLPDSARLTLVLGVVISAVGLGLCVTGVGGLRRQFQHLGRWGNRVQQGMWSRRSAHVLFLLAIFLICCYSIFPLTASTADADDVRYMDAARFNKQMGWNMNRYAHIYGLKAFIWAADGDAFLASRLHWTFLFGVTVVAIAIAIRSLGSGLQLQTLIVALFLLGAQSYLFGGIGASYADYSAMMFVAVGVAVYLHGYGARSPSFPKGHLVALGALTVAAAKSKEPGLIMLWLALALIWTEGRIDIRHFFRRMVWWALGATGAYLILMTLDALVLGDFWFSLRLESLAGARRLKDAAEGIWQLSRFAWLDVAWSHGASRYLSLLAVLAAAMALVRRRPAELRMIFCMPCAFMAMMIAIHPAISSLRYLFPIVPVACLVGAMMFRELGLVSRIGQGRPKLRTAVLLACLVAFFGTGFGDNWRSLTRHRAVQMGDWTLYPWQVFRHEIEAARPKEILVSSRLYRTYRMMGKSKTRDRIARMFFERRHLKLRVRENLEPSTEIAVVTRQEFKNWTAVHPDLKTRALFDPSGQIVLIRSGD